MEKIGKKVRKMKGEKSDKKDRGMEISTEATDVMRILFSEDEIEDEIKEKKRKK